MQARPPRIKVSRITAASNRARPSCEGVFKAATAKGLQQSPIKTASAHTVADAGVVSDPYDPCHAQVVG